MSHRETLGAVDLGSNSFHLVLSRVVRGELQVVDRLRESVRLAAGLSSDNRLSEEAIARGMQAMTIFGQRLRDAPPGTVRAVGTSTLRKAVNASDFLERARQRLGHPIEVVSGREEARLIYLGVAHSIADDPGRRLVVDIGGGSTECIIGERFDTLLADSLDMGCVAYTQQFFADGDIKPQAMKAAQTAALLELQTMQRRYRIVGWDHAVGSSGTIESVATIIRECGWNQRAITRASLEKLQKALLQAGKTAKLQLAGLRPDRVAVLPAGVAILMAVFEALEIKTLVAAAGAMREGVLYDLLGRIRHDDMRDRTIVAMAERWHVDLEQSARVERTALGLLKSVHRAWAIDTERARQLLGWAARLHEVGLAVAYSGYHKHGAYLVQNSDMPGFSRDEQAAVAELIRTHRRKLASLFRDEPPLKSELGLRLTLLLRLAVLLNRPRSSRQLPPLHLEVDKQVLRLRLSAKWLEDHPLTVADLDREREELADLGWTLVVG